MKNLSKINYSRKTNGYNQCDSVFYRFLYKLQRVALWYGKGHFAIFDILQIIYISTIFVNFRYLIFLTVGFLTECKIRTRFHISFAILQQLHAYTTRSAKFAPRELLTMSKINCSNDRNTNLLIYM